MEKIASSSRRSSGAVARSLSPSGRFYCNPTAQSPSCDSAFASSTSSTFSSRSSSFFKRSASPTRVGLYGSTPSVASSIRFLIDRSISPSRSIEALPRSQVVQRQSGGPLPAPSGKKRTCMCSPTTHPGSFRCSLHKNFGSHSHHSPTPYQSNRLNARRSAMTNSLVRIATVEGDLVKRALSALIRPSSHQQRRRAAFQPKPSRLSIMSKAEDS
ncbi:hypothetical protein Nepgr_032513 [Nepenthes gracilis]|uniref:Serine-rich protein-like protein n=1 Tax=Nepenthes gracilis TaxID=150966 RepID=A0AAD3TJE1_NEPGR|nr:hypothetical protein Nepgr_032513 [Nepenthes gracilis]